MRLILMSDTHTNYEGLYSVIRKYSGMDAVVHCGDILVPKQKVPGIIAVAGNMDRDPDYPFEQTLEAEGLRILVKHGHDLFVGARPDYRAVARYAKKNGYDAVFFGHSHTYYDGEENGIRLLNPGSLWKNRDESPRSYMEVTIENRVITAVRRSAIDLM